MFLDFCFFRFMFLQLSTYHLVCLVASLQFVLISAFQLILNKQKEKECLFLAAVGYANSKLQKLMNIE